MADKTPIKGGRAPASPLTSYLKSAADGDRKAGEARSAAVEKAQRGVISKVRAALKEAGVAPDALAASVRAAFYAARSGHDEPIERVLAEHEAAITLALAAAGLDQPEAVARVRAAYGVQDRTFAEGPFLTGVAGVFPSDGKAGE